MTELLRTDDDLAFETWWDEYRLVSWRRGLMDDEKNKPMPPNWARGNEVYVRLGWDAHRVHGGEINRLREQLAAELKWRQDNSND